MTDEEYMQYALNLAKKGCGFVNPNPMVGAVIVKNGKIIGTGYHEKYGELHAERNALKNVIDSPKGATLYVTLEPCCHYGKTPPCTEAIIESGISKVVIGSLDPNPLVSGKGISTLREHGILVVEGILKEECDQLNEVFFHFIKTKLPFVLMKYAMTMDGKIATYSGKSKWITGENARQQVQEDRHRYYAIMVGVGTVLYDNPMLTCRLPNAKQPLRIICDTKLRTPLHAKVVTTANEFDTLIATCCNDMEKQKPFKEAGCEILVVPKDGEHIDMVALMHMLGEIKVDSILLEGGSSLNWSMLNAGLVKKVKTYIAPKLFGGKLAKTPIGGVGVESPENAFYLKQIEIHQIGEDILIESEVIRRCLPD